MPTETRPFVGDGSTFEELVEALMAEPIQKDRAPAAEQLKLLDLSENEEREERN